MGNNEKQLTPRERLEKDVEKSKLLLSSITGQDLVNRQIMFEVELNKLMERHRVPTSLIIATLVKTTSTLLQQAEHVVIEESFQQIKCYIDKNFVTKKDFDVLVMGIVDLKKKLEGESFKAEIE